MVKRLLIADDQIASREALSILARNRGYEVDTVNNGVELINLLSKNKFDVVITDIIMPGLNGAVASEIIKAQGSDVHIIALTGLPSSDMYFVENKFNKVYHKPVNADELFRYVESL
jgi:CheY-like chemotaxis protein